MPVSNRTQISPRAVKLCYMYVFVSNFPNGLNIEIIELMTNLFLKDTSSAEK